MTGEIPLTAAGFVPPVTDPDRPVIVVQARADDKEALRSQMKFLFGTTPVLNFGDGEGLIDFLSQQGATSPKLILVDLDLEGADTLGDLRMRPSLVDTPIIVTSEAATRQQIKAALTKGAQAFVPKPYNRRAFLDIFRGRAGPVPEMTPT